MDRRDAETPIRRRIPHRSREAWRAPPHAPAEALSLLERDALDKSRAIVITLMTPGARWPTQRQLRRAWRAIQALEGAERLAARGQAQAPRP